MKLAVFVIVLHGFLFSLKAARFSVVVADIPRPVTIEFPEGFHLADTPAARERRERFLNFYRLNPAYKGKYGDVLLTNWVGSYRLPILVVGVLGSTSRVQGKITKKEWASLRETLLTSSPEKIKEIREKWRPIIETNSPVPFKTTEELLWFEQQRDTFSAALLAHLRQEFDGKLETVLSARKFLYHDGYVVFVNIAVDASNPDALKTLKQYVDSIRIISI